MPSFWSRIFPARSLAAIEAPAWARIDARVASANELESPFTGLRCATAKWWLLKERTIHSNRGGGHNLEYTTLASGWLGESIVLASADGPNVRVALARAVLANDVDPEDATPLQKMPDLPGLQVSSFDGPLCFREITLCTGDRVELRAVLERVARGGGYRESGADEFRTCPEHGRVEIFDRDLR